MRDLKKIRETAQELAAEAQQSVKAVRQAFTSGIAPIQTVNSGSSQDYVNRLSSLGTLPNLVKSTAQYGVKTAPVGGSALPPKPEIESIEIGTDQNFGMLDAFYTKVTIQLAISELGRASIVRLLRADSGILDVEPPSFSSLTGLSSLRSSKNSDAFGNDAFLAAKIGVGNKLTNFIKEDSFSTQRAVISSGSLRIPPPIVNTNRQNAQAPLISIQNADRSVVENAAFAANRRSFEESPEISIPLSVGKRSGLNILRGKSVTREQIVVTDNNASGYFEVSRVALSIRSVRQVGDFVELDIFDPSVVYGRAYSYYAVCTDQMGRDSVRSRIVTAKIERHAPPPTPTVMYSVIAGRPRFSISCEAEFVDHMEIMRRGGRVPGESILLGGERALISSRPTSVGASGYYHLRDVGTSTDRSVVFVDEAVTPGDHLDYMIYSVDAFGLKGQTAFSCSISLPDHGRPSPLGTPHLTAEQDVGGRVVRISVGCDDPRVMTFLVGRREIGNHETDFRSPDDPDSFMMGRTSPKHIHSRTSGYLISDAKGWNGVLRSVSGSAKLVDTAVGFDRTYQYSVYGVDIRGNRSDYSISSPVKVSVKPVSESPVDFKAELLHEGEMPTAVKLSWHLGTDDFSPNEMVGDQDVLYATSVRSVFQVERRKESAAGWEIMPATTCSYFIDPVSDAPAPSFRPKFAEVNANYDYRVIAMQSGGYISPYTELVKVQIALDMSPPASIWVRSTDLARRPGEVVVSWNYDSGKVEGWDVERAAVNRVYGSKILSMDSSQARSLPYVPVASISRESSQARGISAVEKNRDKLVYVGNRFYVDADISLDNSYFYRVRARSGGNTSTWQYAGILLDDAPYAIKLASTMSDKEKSRLAVSNKPLVKRKR